MWSHAQIRVSQQGVATECAILKIKGQSGCRSNGAAILKRENIKSPMSVRAAITSSISLSQRPGRLRRQLEQSKQSSTGQSTL